MLNGGLGRERKSSLGRKAVKKLRSDVLSDRRPMLKAMSGSAAHQPDVGKVRVPVDQEITVRTVFVLANANLGDRGVPQGGKAPDNVGSHSCRHFGGHQPRLV